MHYSVLSYCLWLLSFCLLSELCKDDNVVCCDETDFIMAPIYIWKTKIFIQPNEFKIKHKTPHNAKKQAQNKIINAQQFVQFNYKKRSNKHGREIVKQYVLI